MTKRSGWALLMLGALAACDGRQTALGPAGRHAQQFYDLFQLFVWVCAIMYVIVIGFMIAAIVRRGGRRRDGVADRGRGDEGPLTTVFVGWIAFITVGLVALTLSSYFTDRAGAAAGSNPSHITIELTAQQWWWDVKYDDPTASNGIRTANELHLPVGVPVHIILKSPDVIHSLWIPNLAGKQDLIPGRQQDITLVPTRTGIFRGQCAEYCGVQHAHMALDVTVEPRAQFDAWRAAQLAPAPAPANPLQQAGMQYVTTRECSVCHAITGTPANGSVGPDLTHVASRRSIAAGTFPMSRGHLYAWIADPQGAKPGTNMPYIGLAPQDLHAVVAYLESLK
jgi:cytochrome c oxidase subunit 2